MPQPTADEQLVLDALRAEGSAPPSYLRCEGRFSTQRAAALLRALEAKGLVVRAYNGHGPNTPWWWEPAARTPKTWTPALVRPGQIWDWGRTTNRVWLRVLAEPDEHELVAVSVKAGYNVAHTTVLPAHYFAMRLSRREPGTRTEFSARFSCSVHGECTEEMVRTDKTCALCGELLNRH